MKAARKTLEDGESTDIQQNDDAKVMMHLNKMYRRYTDQSAHKHTSLSGFFEEFNGAFWRKGSQQLREAIAEELKHLDL